MRTLIVPAIVLSFMAPLTGCYAAEATHRIKLENDFGLTVIHGEAGKSVNISLAQNDQPTISVRVENAGFTNDRAVQVKLCAKCAPAYFLPVWDASSTYGAVTGIIAWADGLWWSLSILPLSGPAVEDPDGDGVIDLVDYTFPMVSFRVSDIHLTAACWRQRSSPPNGAFAAAAAHIISDGLIADGPCANLPLPAVLINACNFAH